MSRVEQKNLIVVVAIVAGLVVGAGVLANYSGILQADPTPEDQSKVSCASEGGSCESTGGTCGSTVAAVSAKTEAEGSCGTCSTEKAASCSDTSAVGCQDKASGCGTSEGSCGDKATDCGSEKKEGCCPVESENIT